MHSYNKFDLVENIKRNDTTLVNYSYLADGTKVEARRYTIGKWLIYRGPFVYRVYTTNSYYPESVEFSGGRVTRTGAMLHVKDYLGSVRAVIDGSTGTIYKASDYSAFGAESPAGSMQIEAIPNNAHPLTTITLRDGYTGKEDQDKDFGTSYTDFGARQYSPTLRRWMVPDPMSEKYYGTSPYAFCGNNPVRFADDNGEDWHDKVVGYFVGGVTNVVPGTGFIRDWYSPDNSADYNSALKRTDEAAAVMGTGMMKAGTGTMAAGGVLATAGVGVTASTAGVGVVVGGPVVAAGAEMAAVGAATAAIGGVMVLNSSKNKSDGYERGRTNKSSEITFRQGSGDKARTVTTKIPKGYRKTKFRSKDMPVFYNGKNYISPDRDGHNGGIWKMAKKKQELENRSVRMGTYDENLKRIGD